MFKCSRYVFSYETPSDEVEDFILRSDDLAAQTYGRDKFFSRLNQVLDQARFLGWPLPRFGPNLPDDLTEIPPPGIDHIFENQAKLLVDIAPVTRVMLESGKYCPVRMVCGTTAAGDLVWKCHLLTDRDGNPYVQRKKQQLKVKTKGTRIICHTDSLPYDEKYMFECFGGEESGIWPVPFLPEFFLDRPIAQKFSPEAGVVEVVKIHEIEPVSVFAKELVPWYRPLEIDRSRALAFDDNLYDEIGAEEFIHTDYPSKFEDNEEDEDEDEDDEESDEDIDPEALVEGWDDFDEEEAFNLDNGDTDVVSLTNFVASLTPSEEVKLAEYDSIISNSNIASRAEAESLRKDPEHKERAEEWLVTAVNRLGLLANHSEKIGALVSLVEKHRGQQLLIIQPRQKWAEKLVEILQGRGLDAVIYDPQNKAQTSRYYEGALKIMITSQAKEELFIEDSIIISVSTFNIIPWLDWLNPSQAVYTIPTKQLGYTDYNFVPEHPLLQVDIDYYRGPGLDILDLEAEVINKPKPKRSKPQAEPVESEKQADSTDNTVTAVATIAAKPKVKKETKPKYKVKTGKGRPKSASTYEKALEIAKKFEGKGQKCEIFAPDGKDALYITGMPEHLQGELD